MLLIGVVHPNYEAMSATSACRSMHLPISAVHLNLDGVTDLADLVVVLQSWSAGQAGQGRQTDESAEHAIPE